MSKLNGPLADILDMAFDELMSNVHTMLPGVVESYDPDKREASVKPVLKKMFANGQEVEMPVITNVPVMLMGTQDALFNFPLKKGAGVMLVFSERSTEEWLLTGNAEVAADPRRFSLSDAVAIPGLFSRAKPGKLGTTDGLEILYKDTIFRMKDNGDVLVSSAGKVVVDGSEVDLAGNTKTLVTYAALNTAFQTLLGTLNTLLGTKLDGVGAPGTLTLNISTAEATKVKTS